MSTLSFGDFCERLTMEDILKAAGYRFNRRDGMRYPSYVAVDSQGHRIKGDKFIVMPDRRRCFQPPFQQTYNVISFIRAFPEKFPEYHMSMSTNKLINLVCNRLLNTPVEMNQSGFKTIYVHKPFDLNKYQITTFDLDNWEKMRQFYPYFRARGIDFSTMRAFSGSFLLTSKASSSGKVRQNLSFPLRKPSTEEDSRVLGLELRSRPDKDGKTRFKGLAQGSEATIGLWMATPDTQQWKRDLQNSNSIREKRTSSKEPYGRPSEYNRSSVPPTESAALAEVRAKNETEVNIGNVPSVSKSSGPYPHPNPSHDLRNYSRDYPQDQNQVLESSKDQKNEVSDDSVSAEPDLNPIEHNSVSQSDQGVANQKLDYEHTANQTQDKVVKIHEEYKLPSLPQNGDIYWFESAYDAMAYYQLHRCKIDFKDAIFVSTSGNPSVRQFQAVMEQFPKNRHHLCFDNDMAGRMFTLNFLLQLKGKDYCTRMDNSKDELVVYDEWKREPLWHIPTKEFNMQRLCYILEIDPNTYIREVPISGYKDWNDQLLGMLAKRNSTLVHSTGPVSQNQGLQKRHTDTQVVTETEPNRKVQSYEQSNIQLPQHQPLPPQQLTQPHQQKQPQHHPQKQPLSPYQQTQPQTQPKSTGYRIKL